jgi:hypothetical protein
VTPDDERRLVRLEDHYRRRWWRFVPYTFLAVGMGAALLLVSHSASENSLTAERIARLTQDCASRVEARDALRDVVTQAYTPTIPNLPPDVVARYNERRDAVLSRVPRLRCQTRLGIPIPVPADSTTVPTPGSSEGAPVG